VEVLGVWIAAFLTLAIFSFLYKDNPVYKFAEHLFIGISAGYIFIQAISGTLIPNLFHPLGQAFLGKAPEEFHQAPGLLLAIRIREWLVGFRIGWAGNAVRIGALVLSILLLLRFSKRASWISRWPLALMIGAYAALRMTGLAQSDLVEQVNGTMVPMVAQGLPWFSWQGASRVNHLILFVGVISVLIYFFFSVERRTPLRQIGYVGTFFLMITFGSSFGYTVLGRISLLIGRVQDLYLFAERRYGYASIGCALLMIGYLVVWELRNRQRTSPLPPG
jgi:hypothetical protein